MSSTEDTDLPSLPEKEMGLLNSRQREIYSNKLARFAEYLNEEGKEPKRQKGI